MRSKLHGRKDANQALLDERFRQNYCSVFDSSQVGNDFPDAVVSYGGFTVLVEYKVRTGKLSPGQERFIRDWRGPVRVCFTVDDVDQVAEWMRRQAGKLG